MILFNTSLFFLIINSLILVDLGLSEIIVPILVYFFMSLKIIYDNKIQKSDIKLIFVLIILYIISRQPYIFWIYFMQKILENKKKEYVTQNIIFVMILSSILIILLNINNESYLEFLRNDILLKRYHFGFKNPNYLGMYFFTIITLYYTYIGNMKSLISKLIYCSLCFILYKVTYSRNTLIALLIYLILNVSLERVIKTKINKILKYGMFTLSFISLYLGYFKSENIFINKLLTNRPYAWGEFLKGNISGQKVSYLILNSKLSNSVNLEFPLDNGYIFMWVTNGIVFTLIIIYFSIKIINQIVKENKIKDCIYIISFLCMNMGETAFFRPILMGILPIIILENIKKPQKIERKFKL